MRVRHASSSSGVKGTKCSKPAGAAVPPGERSAGPDPRRLERERAEQPVDVVRDVRGGRPRGTELGIGREQPFACGREAFVLVGRKERGHVR